MKHTDAILMAEARISRIGDDLNEEISSRDNQNRVVMRKRQELTAEEEKLAIIQKRIDGYQREISSMRRSIKVLEADDAKQDASPGPLAG